MKNLFTFFFVFLLFAFHASGQYITIWKTDNAGESANNQIIIPATGTDYSVAWEEVGNPANNGATTASGHYTLTFPAPGIYQVSISPGSGTFTQINFGGESDVKYVLSGNFVQPVDAWNVSNVTDMFLMFALADSFNQPVNNWDVTKVTNMLYMFAIAANFNQPLSKWTLASAPVMLSMLQGTQMDCVNMASRCKAGQPMLLHPIALFLARKTLVTAFRRRRQWDRMSGPCGRID